MTMDLIKEQERFNALTPAAATALLTQMEGQTPAMRSCWYCNGAHEHLMEANYPIHCLWGCGGWYLKGFPAHVVVRRSRGEPITEVEMQDFERVFPFLKEGPSSSEFRVAAEERARRCISVGWMQLAENDLKTGGNFFFCSEKDFLLAFAPRKI